MIRILLATGLYPPESGGPATYTKLLEERLPKADFEVSVLPFRTVRYLPPGIRHFVYFWKVLRTRSDIVYAQDTISVGLPSMLAAKLTGRIFLVRVPGDYAWEQARQRYGVVDELEQFQKKTYSGRVELLRNLQRFVVRSATAVVVPSEYMKRIVSNWRAHNVHVIYSSITLPPPIQLPVDRPEGFLVVTIARPVPWKGLDGLKRAVEREYSWTLKIINDLPYAEAMGWLKVADAFALNSTYEGLSHALVEAMSLGTPVVATRVGGNVELITDNVDGLLIPLKDDDALHAALKQIHDNPTAARERAERAKEKTKEFDIDRTIEQVSNLLTTCVYS